MLKLHRPHVCIVSCQANPLQARSFFQILSSETLCREGIKKNALKVLTWSLISLNNSGLLAATSTAYASNCSATALEQIIYMNWNPDLKAETACSQ